MLERSLLDSESGYSDIESSCFLRNCLTPEWHPNGFTFELKSIISSLGVFIEYKPPCEAGLWDLTNRLTLIFNV